MEKDAIFKWHNPSQNCDGESPTVLKGELPAITGREHHKSITLSEHDL